MHALLIAAALLLASPTKAPSAEEQRLYDEGVRALAAGDARAAERAFKAGYALARDPAFLVHVGEAQEKAGGGAEAADSYRRYLREAPDAADRADIEARLARLAPAPATPPAAAAAPSETPGEFGASPPAPATPPPAPATSPPLAPADAERPARPGAPSDDGWTRYNVTAVIATGAALLLGGTAAFFAAQAGSDADDINRLIAYRDQKTDAPIPYSDVAKAYEKATADGRDHDRYAKVALIAAGGAAALAAVFYVLDAKLGDEPVVSNAPAGAGVAATGGWRWRF